MTAIGVPIESAADETAERTYRRRIWAWAFYDWADHGFLAYTRRFYRPDDAKLAWKRTTEFLGKHLKEK